MNIDTKLPDDRAVEHELNTKIKDNLFDYDKAFSRNIGFVTAEEQNILKNKCIAIAGMGGVGGAYLIALSRLGISAFHIADFDRFELANFNRQVGASMSTIGHPKVSVMSERAHDINPEIKIKEFVNGVTKHNISEFLEGVDIYLDGLDFFVLDIRELIFAECKRRGIPAITVAPAGMGAARVTFMPHSMSFEDYFCFHDCSELEKQIRFLVGLTPKALHRHSVVDPTRLDLKNHKAPSTPMGVELCTGVAATEVLKILLARGSVRAAPWSSHYDAYENHLAHSWLPWGNRNPIQRLKLIMAKHQITKLGNNMPMTENLELTLAQKIANIARWAPSGDNCQPWRFEFVDENHLVISEHQDIDNDVYDLHGQARYLSIGALLENISMAASIFESVAAITRRKIENGSHLVFDVEFKKDDTVKPHPLTPYITRRSTQRCRMSRRLLSESEKLSLEDALGSYLQVKWFDGLRKRWPLMKILSQFTDVRLNIPEAFKVHQRVIDWHARFSTDRIPDQALGLTNLTLRLMKWALQKWSRQQFMNKYLAGTFVPRLEMDFIPGIFCGAYFVLYSKQPLENDEDYINAGRGMQRFWLTATRLGLQLQPQYMFIVFPYYIRNQVMFTNSSFAINKSRDATKQFEELIGVEESAKSFFAGRIGTGENPVARSIRLDLKDLMPGE